MQPNEPLSDTLGYSRYLVLFKHHKSEIFLTEKYLWTNKSRQVNLTRAVLYIHQCFPKLSKLYVKPHYH